MNLNQIKRQREQNLKTNYDNIETNYLNENSTSNNNFNYFTTSNIYTKKTYKSNPTPFTNTYSNFYNQKSLL